MAQKQNRWYHGVEGLWKEAEGVYAFTDGRWKECRLKMVADPDWGYWREAFNNEADGASEIFDITSLSDRGLFQGNGNLYLYGPNMLGVVLPDPGNYAFYSLRGTKIDVLENFGDLTLYGDTQIIYHMIDGILAVVTKSGEHQYMRFPSGGSGYDYKGLIGNTGKAHFEIGMKHRPSELPGTGEIAVLLQAGVAGRRVSIYYDEDGTLYGSYECLGHNCVVSIVGALEVDVWTGFILQHDSGSLTLTLHDETAETSVLDVVPDCEPPIDIPMFLMKGDYYNYVVSEDFFLTTNCYSGVTVDPSGLSYSILTDDYRSAMPSGDMPGGTGKYCIEVIPEGLDLHIGVANPEDVSLTEAPGIWGWAINTINGRKFDHQVGGGTEWDSAIPLGSIVGILYDSDIGAFDVYVNGVIRPRPFSAGTITGTVRFVVGGCGEIATSTYLNPTVVVDPGSWTYDPALTPPSVPVPFSLVPGATTTGYALGISRDVVVRNAVMTNTIDVIDPVPTIRYFMQNLRSMAIADITNWIVSAKDTYSILVVPSDLPAGNYELYAEHINEGVSAKRFFTVYENVPETETLNVDFSNTTLIRLNKKFLAAHKKWGGANGGVVTECLTLDTINGVMRVKACGDNYTGDILGVDMFGQPSGFNTRIGGCIVTRGYYGPGSFRVVCKFPPVIGVASAFWTFHYEEGYPIHPVYNSIKADGLADQGNYYDGFYNVRNHEIDIELPVALVPPLDENVTYQNAWFNSWHGEIEYINNPVNHGIVLNDDNFHEMRFDWHLGIDSRVEWYIDSVHYLTCRDYVPDIPGRFWSGLWFPSGGVKWAGPTAAWEYQEMLIRSIRINPFLDEYDDLRNIGETYPNVGFRPIRQVING